LSSEFSSLIGKTLKPGFFKIKAKKLVAYAKCLKVKQPEFLGEDPVAHPTYANAYIAPLDHLLLRIYSNSYMVVTTIDFQKMRPLSRGEIR
jgi:hypothetical protein